MEREITINENPKSQRDAVLWHFHTHGSITSWEAIKEYGITRLGHYVFILRKEGYKIHTQPITKKNRFGHAVTYANYLYIKPVKLGEQTKMF